MMFWISVAVLLGVSFLWALHGLSSELAKPKELAKIKENLHKEKVLFKRK
ncbi:MAG: hypothetical protein KBC63_03450 [Candidatus Levybacteria bacterium]|nr:hypothetical protein [Candidatus Levybacteria bacterium]